MVVVDGARLRGHYRSALSGDAKLPKQMGFSRSLYNERLVVVEAKA